MCTEEQFKPKTIIQFMCKQTKELKYGRVDWVERGQAFVQIADGVFMVLTPESSIWSFVPVRYIEAAKTAISVSIDVARTWVCCFNPHWPKVALLKPRKWIEKVPMACSHADFPDLPSKQGPKSATEVHSHEHVKRSCPAPCSLAGSQDWHPSRA